MNDELGAAVATPAGATVDGTKTADDDSNVIARTGTGVYQVRW